MDMMATQIACPMCGFLFDPEGQGHCSACPLAQGCHIACCPACGYQTPDVQQTLIGRWLSGGRRQRRRHGQHDAAGQTLADVPPGWCARIVGMNHGPGLRRQRLRAYGLEASTRVRVLQQHPVTVVTIGETELALEADLARGVQVDSLEP